jgi:hypothetical protein
LCHTDGLGEPEILDGEVALGRNGGMAVSREINITASVLAVVLHGR